MLTTGTPHAIASAGLPACPGRLLDFWLRPGLPTTAVAGIAHETERLVMIGVPAEETRGIHTAFIRQDLEREVFRKIETVVRGRELSQMPLDGDRQSGQLGRTPGDQFIQGLGAGRTECCPDALSQDELGQAYFLELCPQYPQGLRWQLAYAVEYLDPRYWVTQINLKPPGRCFS